MRYIGLIMGMLLLSNQAFAEKYIGSSAEKIITKGEIIHSHIENNSLGHSHEMRVIFKSKYYYCYDFFNRSRFDLVLVCLSVEER